MYGDGVPDAEPSRSSSSTAGREKLAKVTGFRPASRFGELDSRGDLAEEVCEKPQLDERWINGGLLVFRRKALDYVGPDKILEREPLERPARDGQLAVFRHDGSWRPMDTMHERRAVQAEWASGKLAW